MSTGCLTIDLDAIVANWRALDGASAATVETAATVKADAYGLGVGPVARALARAGVQTYFVAVAEEGAAVREALGPGPAIYVYSGHMPGDTEMITDLGLIPLLNTIEQATRHMEAAGDCPFGIQLDTGMNRLGMEHGEWAAIRQLVLTRQPKLIISHLACSDDPDHPMNAQQLAEFHEMTAATGVPLSLAATGGILLGPDYHFDITRPGIGIYGGLPFAEANPVVWLSLPVIQIRDVDPGESVGYSNTWIAERPARIATVSAGYADGIHRAISNNATLYANDQPCPLIGRVSMDLITVDITHLNSEPAALDLIAQTQGIDSLSEAAGTIGYEILTSLGSRFSRRYRGGQSA